MTNIAVVLKSHIKQIYCKTHTYITGDVDTNLYRSEE